MKDIRGRGGGQVVSVLAFHSDDRSSNPADVLVSRLKLLLNRMIISKKRPVLAIFLKKEKKATFRFLPTTKNVFPKSADLCLLYIAYCLDNK